MGLYFFKSEILLNLQPTNVTIFSEKSNYHTDKSRPLFPAGEGRGHRLEYRRD